MNRQKKGALCGKRSANVKLMSLKIANSNRLSNSFFVGFSLGTVTDHKRREQLLLEFLEPSVQETFSYFELSSFFDGLVKALRLGGYYE
jgi:hypothetical protein